MVGDGGSRVPYWQKWFSLQVHVVAFSSFPSKRKSVQRGTVSDHSYHRGDPPQQFLGVILIASPETIRGDPQTRDVVRFLKVRWLIIFNIVYILYILRHGYTSTSILVILVFIYSRACTFLSVLYIVV